MVACAAFAHHNGFVSKPLSKQIKEYFREAGRKGAEKVNAAKTPAQRSEAASKAAQARWAKKKK
jgi:hypothetical protein